MSLALDQRTLKTILIPLEHGAWGFLIEGVLAGLMLNPSINSLILTVDIALVFFGGQAFRYYLGSYQKRQIDHRVNLALLLSAILILLAALLFILLKQFYTSTIMSVIGVGSVLLMVQILISQIWGRKSILAELLGAGVLGIVASAMLCTKNYSQFLIYSVWGLLALRAITSVIYVRHQLRKSLGRPYSKKVVIGLHVLMLCIIVYLVEIEKVFSVEVLVGVFMLFIRAIWGITQKIKQTPKQIGVSEIIWGVIYVFIVVKAFHV